MMLFDSKLIAAADGVCIDAGRVVKEEEERGVRLLEASLHVVVSN